MNEPNNHKRAAKSPAESAVESRFLLMPSQANPHGTAFGGAILSAIDMIASMAAQRHCRGMAVTVGIDSITFDEPICIGDQVVCQACVNYAGHTSMEVGVRVIRENPASGLRRIATTAHLIFVAVDEKTHRPISVPAIEPQTEEEKRRYENARTRVKARRELRKKIKSAPFEQS